MNFESIINNNKNEGENRQGSYAIANMLEDDNDDIPSVKDSSESPEDEEVK